MTKAKKEKIYRILIKIFFWWALIIASLYGSYLVWEEHREIKKMIEEGKNE